MVPIHEKFSAGLRVYYSPEFSLDTGQNWVFEGTVERVLAPIRTVTPILSESLGYQDDDESKSNIDY